MNLNSLKVFHAVATSENVTMASIRLNCVQSNVSARIKQLEEELGVKLFLRMHKRLLLTRHGKMLFEAAKKILEIESEIEDKLKEADKMEANISIGFINAVLSVNLYSYIRNFHEQNQDITLKLISGGLEELVLDILNYKIDGAFLDRMIDNPSLENIPIFEDKLVIVSNRQVDKVSNLNNYDIICLKKKEYIKGNRISKKLNINEGRIIEVESFESLFGFVASGMGIAIIPASLIKKRNYHNLFYINLPDDKGNMNIVYVKRKDRVFTDSIGRFLNMLKERIGFNDNFFAIS